MSSTPQSIFDQQSGNHAPELYHPTSTAVLFESLQGAHEHMLQKMTEDGYVGIRIGLSEEVVAGCLRELEEIVQGKNATFEEDLAISNHLAALGTLDFKDGKHHAFIQFEANAKDAPLSERTNYVRKLMGFTQHSKFLQDVAFNKDLMRFVRSGLGVNCDDEVELFQDMALLKGVGGREKPWHQDHAYFNIPLEAPVVGVWIALDEATHENGCMHCLPGLHRNSSALPSLPPSLASHVSAGSNGDGTNASVFTHFMRRDFQLCDELVSAIAGKSEQGVVQVPLPAGGLMVFDSKLPHGTPTNKTATRRRALQFHYARKQTQRISDEERTNRFGAQGKSAQC